MILCCGEALIDMLPRRSREDEPAFAPHPGGAVFNTAIALGRLGAPAGFFCGVSHDLFGEMLMEALAGSQVDAALCPRSEAPTTLAFVQLVEGQARYAFYDENTALRRLSAADLPDTTAEALFFGGISLVGEPCGAAYEALLHRDAGRAVIMMDPNIRPSFITDEAAFRARLTRMLARTDIVKISDEDLHWLMGAGDSLALARQLLGAGPSLVLLTKGAEGAHGITAAGDIFVPSQRASVVDTVGAGDTFNAGALAALHEAGALTRQGFASLGDEAIRAALSLGAAAAAVTVSRAGANPPWRHEL